MSQGAPIGNRNAAKAKRLEESIRLSLQTYAKDGIEPGKALRKITDNVIGMAVSGDKWAIEFVADRIDGKPTQSVHQKHEHSVSESISEEHARLVAQGFLDSLRSPTSDSSQEPDRLHGELPP